MGGFSIISLIYVALGVRVLWQIVQNWSAVWDRNFTPQDRMLVSQAGFFVLVPISVALHELGHAVAVWAFGKQVVDWGFYGYAGYVAYFPSGLSAVQQTIISAAGTLVNIVLCALAFAVVQFWKPPLRAAFNELLLSFAFISGINAFIVYPVLDLVSGLNGDWRQMYDSGVPWLTGLIVAAQIGVLALGWWLYTNPGQKRLYAQRTAVPPGYQRSLLGSLQPATVQETQMNPGELRMREAARNVASGWQARVETHVQRFANGSAVLLQWNDNGRVRVVAVRVVRGDVTEIVQIPVGSDNQQGGVPVVTQRWSTIPPVDQMTLGLRLAMEDANHAG